MPPLHPRKVQVRAVIPPRSGQGYWRTVPGETGLAVDAGRYRICTTNEVASPVPAPRGRHQKVAKTCARASQAQVRRLAFCDRESGNALLRRQLPVHQGPKLSLEVCTHVRGHQTRIHCGHQHAAASNLGPKPGREARDSAFCSSVAATTQNHTSAHGQWIDSTA